MKKLYRRLMLCVRYFGQSIRVRKQWVGEHLELYRIFHSIPVKNFTLSQKQKNDIQAYWEPKLGKKISTKWHRKYTAFNRSFDVRYFPEILYSTKLEPAFNPDWITYPLSDKNLTEMLFAKVLCKNNMVTVPKTLTGCAGGFFFDHGRNPVSRQDCLEILKQCTGEYIIKPTQGESSGHGVRLIDMEHGIDQITGDHADDIIDLYKRDFIVQEKIKQHDCYGKLHPTSINTIRILTYRIDGEIRSAPAVMRIGTGGSHLDNAHAGGVFVGISDEGVLQEKVYKYYCNPCTAHPDTKIEFNGYCLPYMPNIVAAAKELHACLPGVGFVNWDFAVSEDNQIVLIESNLSCGSLWLFQIAWGMGVFRDDTDYMIRLLRDGI